MNDPDKITPERVETWLEFADGSACSPPRWELPNVIRPDADPGAVVELTMWFSVKGGEGSLAWRFCEQEIERMKARKIEPGEPPADLRARLEARAGQVPDVEILL